MSDIESPDARSRNMSAIHSKDTKPEMMLRKALWKKGYRYRKNYKGLIGKPDIVLTKYRICIFVDSEFFHGKGFKSGYESKKYNSLEEQLRHGNNAEFWLNKIKKNMERDREVDQALEAEGWTVLRFWSKDVMEKLDECIRAIDEAVFTTNLN